MITIQSGKLLIPEEDRFVGFAGDNLGNTKEFVLPDRGMDYARYTLCLRFDDESVRVIPLEKYMRGSDLVLTWSIQSAHLSRAGIVMAQVKSVDSDDVIQHTTCDYFIVAQSADHTDDGGEESYVTRDEVEERLSDFLEQIASRAPYIGEDGYWYFYDVESDSYIRGQKAMADVTVDDAMIQGSVNPVQSRVIKAFVENALDTKADKTTRIANLQLNGDISSADLAAQIRADINPPLVVPGTTIGYGGQYGKTMDGEPVMCRFSNVWKKLATEDELNAKMALTPNISITDLNTLPSGQLFICQDGVAVKVDDTPGYVELARASTVYSKYEIDLMIGNVETLLAAL